MVEIAGLAEEFLRAKSVIICWAMGITQHRDAVATIQEMVNVLLLQGNIGRPGAGVCPVRGHSNVQGDRTMGIYEKMPDPWLDRLGAVLGAAEPDFDHAVVPLLRKHCAECHAGDKKKGGFSLNDRASTLAGGESGKAVVPGNAAKSPLIEAITSKDPDKQMPPKGARRSRRSAPCGRSRA